MKIALPQWQDRVSPVFDVAERILLVDSSGEKEPTRQEAELHATEPRARAAELVGLGTEVLLCGAISRPMEWAIHATGIEVISQICGKVDEVLSAFLEDRLDEPDFAMPGCRRRGGRPCRTRRRGRRSERARRMGGWDHAQR